MKLKEVISNLDDGKRHVYIEYDGWVIGTVDYVHNHFNYVNIDVIAQQSQYKASSINWISTKWIMYMGSKEDLIEYCKDRFDVFF